jgi:hypothetical protein
VDPARLASEIERLDAEATPGPWERETVRTSIGSCHKIGPLPGTVIGETGHACIYADFEGVEPTSDRGRELLVDADIITLLRNHAPQIARALRLLERASEFVTPHLNYGKEWHDDYRALLEEAGDAG